LALLATVFSSAPVFAGWSGGNGYNMIGGGGSTTTTTSSASGVPEIDASVAAGAISLLVGGVFLLRDRLGVRRQSRE
jgi:hypothetical protein